MESALTQSQWTPERVELIKRTVCPAGISDDEFLLFMEQCKRSGLDPLLKEAFCVPRRKNVGTREHPQWVVSHEFQPSEAGMLARAERFSDYEGTQASAVREGDEVRIDAGHGEVAHTYCPTARTGAIAGAWARVQRRAHVAVVVWLDFAGYAQASPLWAKIPATMIEKCARVAALRKAYPEAFGGLYIREEMPPAEDTQGCVCDNDAHAPPTPETHALLEATHPPTQVAISNDAGAAVRVSETASARTPETEEAIEAWSTQMTATIQRALAGEMDSLIRKVAALPKGELRTRLGGAINARRRELRARTKGQKRAHP